jgi:TrmH family RNA methyltransferase
LKQITSIQNPFIKSLVLLQEKAKTENKQVLLIEGKREISLALKGYELESILFYPVLKLRQKNIEYYELIEISATYLKALTRCYRHAR